MKRTCKECEKCKREISYSNFQRHIDSCKGPKIKKIRGIDYDPNSGYINGSREPWNKDKTKKSDCRIAKGAETFKRRYANNEFELNNNSPSIESRQKISESMKIAHSEGRAWNIGKSRWNNEPSYPETFFMRVIENEFTDKQYTREYPMGIYSLDFAWPHLKKAIEIDGEQHQRFQEYIDRDNRKDAFIRDSGWSVLRIAWKDLFNDPKTLIYNSISFIHSGV
jgi:very-short-patch-repair endonuclease